MANKTLLDLDEQNTQWSSNSNIDDRPPLGTMESQFSLSIYENMHNNLPTNFYQQFFLSPTNNVENDVAMDQQTLMDVPERSLDDNEDIPYSNDITIDEFIMLMSNDSQSYNGLSTTPQEFDVTKKRANTPNPKYITINTKYGSLFRDNPITKRAKTPLFTSPSSSHANSTPQSNITSPPTNETPPLQYPMSRQLPTLMPNNTETIETMFNMLDGQVEDIDLGVITPPTIIELPSTPLLSFDHISDGFEGGKDCCNTLLDFVEGEIDLTCTETLESEREVDNVTNNMQLPDPLGCEDPNTNGHHYNLDLHGLHLMPTITSNNVGPIPPNTNSVENSATLTYKMKRKNTPKATKVHTMNDDGKKSDKNIEGVYYNTRWKLWEARLTDSNKKQTSFGLFNTMEEASRIRDLGMLKLKGSSSKLNNPQYDYVQDLIEMQKWDKRDYFWSLKRHSVRFNNKSTIYKGIRRAHKSPKWIVKVGCSKVIHSQKFAQLGTYEDPAVAAIVYDIGTLCFNTWDRADTNYRPGLYSLEDVQNFEKLVKERKMDDVLKWDLIPRILAESLPPPRQIIPSSINSKIGATNDLQTTHEENTSSIFNLFDLEDQTTMKRSNDNDTEIRPNHVLAQQSIQLEDTIDMQSTNIQQVTEGESVRFEYMPHNVDECDPYYPIEMSMKLSWDRVYRSNGPAKNWMERLHPRAIGKCFMLFSLEHIEAAWNYYIYNHDKSHAKLWLDTCGVPTWTPKHIIGQIVEKREYDRYFPCIVGIRSRYIFALDAQLYHESQPIHIQHCQKQWLSMPNLRFMPNGVTTVIAGNAGLLVVGGGNQPQPLSTNRLKNEWAKLQEPYRHVWQELDYQEAKGQSMIFVVNPLTREYRLLPPIPFKVLRGMAADFKFYEVDRIDYRLIVVGTCESKTMSEDVTIVQKKSKSRSKQSNVALAIYCSRQNKWVHFDLIPNASSSLPPKDLTYCGRSGIALLDHSVFYGGLMLTSDIYKHFGAQVPALFYFNFKNGEEQHLAFDFSTVAMQYVVEVVEPPRLLKIGLETIFAVTLGVSPVDNEDPKFIITQVLLNEDGSPSGSFNMVRNGVMPYRLFQLLFRTRVIDNDVLEKYTEGNLLPSNVQEKEGRPPPVWEVVGNENFVAVKIASQDPLIALYDVKSMEWGYTAFPYMTVREAFDDNRHHNWMFASGVYEPIWLAVP